MKTAGPAAGPAADGTPSGACSPAPPGGGEPLSEGTLAALHSAMFPDRLGADDVARWFGNGFVFSEYEGTGFGLLQDSGGPCGVLAAVQAFVLRFLLFGGADMEDAGVLSEASRGKAVGNLSEGVDAGRSDAVNVDDADLQRALALSLKEDGSSTKTEGNSTDDDNEDEAELKRALQLSLVGSASNAGSSSSSDSAGGKDDINQGVQSWRNPKRELQQAALTDALARILMQAVTSDGDGSSDSGGAKCATTGSSSSSSQQNPPDSGVVSLIVLTSAKYIPINRNTPAHAYQTVEFPISNTTFTTLRNFLSRNDILEMFQSASGVMLFVYSLILSRGLRRCREDMDDPGASFTAEYGHGTQELLNLLLLGYASSQVHDGDVELGDSGMRLKGVRGTPQIGLISFLEALRYTEVGDYFKTPVWPIWVVGSQSHYTVLFGLDRAACGDDDEEALMKRAKRAFRTVDKEDTGFVSVGALESVFNALEMRRKAVMPSSSEVQSLASTLDTTGAGIVLWSDFTKPAIQLLQGKTVAEILSDGGSSSSAAIDLSGDSRDNSSAAHLDPIPLHRRDDSPSTPTVRAKKPRLERSDSDYARELYHQLNPGMNSATNLPLESKAAGPSSGGSGAAASSAGAEAAASALLGMNSGNVTSSGGSKARGQPGPGAKIRLFHYNGMKRKIQGEEKGPRLTSCQLWRRVAIGVIGLTTGSSKTAIDDTIRTKWKGAEIEWTDGEAGNING